MNPKFNIVVSVVAGLVLWTAVGCALLKTAPSTDREHYPYHGVLVDTNGIPLNPPRW